MTLPDKLAEYRFRGNFCFSHHVSLLTLVTSPCEKINTTDLERSFQLDDINRSEVVAARRGLRLSGQCESDQRGLFSCCLVVFFVKIFLLKHKLTVLSSYTKQSGVWAESPRQRRLQSSILDSSLSVRELLSYIILPGFCLHFSFLCLCFLLLLLIF